MRPNKQYLNYTQAKEIVFNALPQERQIALDKILSGLPFLQQAILIYGFASKTPGVQPEVAVGLQENFAQELSERHLQPHIQDLPDPAEVLTVLQESGFRPEIITKIVGQ